MSRNSLSEWRNAVRKLDDNGYAVTIELLLLATVLGIGLIAGITSARDAAIGELSDVAGGLQDFNQSFELFGLDGHSSTTHGMNFVDGLDWCDSVDDPAGQIDNCIAVNVLPDDEDGSVSREALGAEINFEDDTGNDSSGNGNDGTLQGGATIVGGVLQLDGDDSVSLANSDDINLGIHEERTISLDFIADDVISRQVLYEEGGVTRGLNIYIDNGSLFFGGWNQPATESGWTHSSLSTPVAAGQWFTAAVVLDGGPTLEPGAFSGFLDGSSIGISSGSQLFSHGGNIAIGGVAGRTRFHDGPSASGTLYGFSGQIDDFYLFNRALSESEVNELAD